jgi:hypothetical protein
MNATTAWRWLVVAWFAACACPTPDADPGHTDLGHNQLNDQLRK